MVIRTTWVTDIYTTFSCTIADDYSVDYTVSEADGIFLQVNDTTRELRMSAGITELILTFNITRDDGPENPEDFLLFLEGARRVFIACPVGSVTIVDILRKGFIRS